MATIVTTDKGGARYSLPPFPTGISPGLAVAIERYRAGYADQEGPDEWCASAAAIHETQLLSLADLAAKLIVAIHYRDPTGSADAFAVDVPDASEDRRAVEMELSCLDWLLVQLPAADDVELSDAFRTTQRAFLELKAQPHDLTDMQAEPFYQRMDTADAVLRTVPALTPAGVVLKLRRAFVDIVGAQWSDDAMRDERPAAFDEALALADRPIKMLWSAIADLMRIAAVSTPAARDTDRWDVIVAALRPARAAWIDAASGSDPARQDAVNAAYNQAMDGLVECRTTDLHQLLEKLEIIEDECGADPMPRDYLDAILADVRHLSRETAVSVPRPASHAWADALTAYEHATASAVAIDGGRDEHAFDKAATAQGEAIDALLDTPAPDMAALATKLRVIHRDGYQHRLAVVLADAERLAGEARS